MTNNPFTWLRLIALILMSLVANIFGYNSPRQFGSTALLEVMHLSIACMPVAVSTVSSVAQNPAWMNYLMIQITSPLVVNTILIGSAALFVVELILMAIKGEEVKAIYVAGLLVSLGVGLASIYFANKPIAILALCIASVIASLPPFRGANEYFAFVFGVCYALSNVNELIKFIKPSLLMLRMPIPLIVSIAFIILSTIVVCTVSVTQKNVMKKQFFFQSIVFPLVYGFAAVTFNFTMTGTIIGFGLGSFMLKQLGYWIAVKKGWRVVLIETTLFVMLQILSYCLYVYFILNIIQFYLLTILSGIIIELVVSKCATASGNLYPTNPEELHWSRVHLC